MSEHDARFSSLLRQLRRGLIVSCQAQRDEPMFGSDMMARLARAAWLGGAVGVRASTPEDIRAIREVTPLPLIGYYKAGSEGVFITPCFEHARVVAEAGADLIAVDGTARPRPGGESLASLIQRIHTELGKPVVADISTVDEALQSVELGADLVATTLSGYIPASQPLKGPDLALVGSLVGRLKAPVIAEGHISTPGEARAALATGAFAVVVGAAITRPQWIAARFVEGMRF